jgi:hypothetical protein
MRFIDRGLRGGRGVRIGIQTTGERRIQILEVNSRGEKFGQRPVEFAYQELRPRCFLTATQDRPVA